MFTPGYNKILSSPPGETRRPFFFEWHRRCVFGLVRSASSSSLAFVSASVLNFDFPFTSASASVLAFALVSVFYFTCVSVSTHFNFHFCLCFSLRFHVYFCLHYYLRFGRRWNVCFSLASTSVLASDLSFTFGFCFCLCFEFWFAFTSVLAFAPASVFYFACASASRNLRTLSFASVCALSFTSASVFTFSSTYVLAVVSTSDLVSLLPLFWLLISPSPLLWISLLAASVLTFDLSFSSVLAFAPASAFTLSSSYLCFGRRFHVWFGLASTSTLVSLLPLFWLLISPSSLDFASASVLTFDLSFASALAFAPASVHFHVYFGSSWYPVSSRSNSRRSRVGRNIWWCSQDPEHDYGVRS